MPLVSPGKINLLANEKKKTEWHRVVIFNEGLVNIVQQYLKKGANVYLEGQLSTRKWRDEKLGQDKYSTEVVLQGFNSSLTMLGGNNQSMKKILKTVKIKAIYQTIKFHKKIQISMTKYRFS